MGEVKNSFVEKIVQNIHLINEELKVIDTEILIQKTKLDILGIDNIGKLVIIEISQTEDDALIFKGLDHFDWILHHIEILQKKYRSFNIDYTLAPEIILISNFFSQDFQRRISYLNKAKIHLYQYWDKDEDFGNLRFTPIKFKSEKITDKQTDSRTPEQIINMIKIDEVKHKCKECLIYIKQLNPNIGIDTSKGIIQFDDEKGYFAAIYPFENFFWINFNPDYWSGKKVDENTELDFDKMLG